MQLLFPCAWPLPVTLLAIIVICLQINSLVGTPNSLSMLVVSVDEGCDSTALPLVSNARCKVVQTEEAFLTLTGNELCLSRA